MVVGHSFPIVGVGASAGGIDALTRLVAALPRRAGLALVVVQHLDPLHDSQLAGILCSQSSLEVVDAEHGITVASKHAYVIQTHSLERLQFVHVHGKNFSKNLSVPTAARRDQTRHDHCSDLEHRAHTSPRGEDNMDMQNSNKSEQGVVGYGLLWFLGVPASVLFVIFLMRGCT